MNVIPRIHQMIIHPTRVISKHMGKTKINSKKEKKKRKKRKKKKFFGALCKIYSASSSERRSTAHSAPALEGLRWSGSDIHEVDFGACGGVEGYC